MRASIVLALASLLAAPCAQAVLTAEDFRTPLEGVPAEHARAAVREAYRAPPDRRFILAVADVSRILAGSTPARRALRREPGRWAILEDDVAVARVDDGAGFQDLWRVLVERAKALASGAPPAASAGAAPAECSPFFAPGAWAALEKAQAAWSARRDDVRALGTAARCLVGLALQHLDALEVGDALPARALAALAAYHVRSGESVAADLAAMAQVMGYRASARELAARSPATSASESRRYLALLDAPGSADARAPELALLRVRFSIDDGRSPIAASRDLPYAVLRSVWEHGGGAGDVGGKALAADAGVIWNLARSLPRVLRVSEEELMPAFERLLARAVRNRAGPFADAEVLAAWYRGYFYSALFTMAQHHLEQLSPARPADEFAARLGAPDDEFAKQFKTWYTAMAAARTARVPPETLLLSFMHAIDAGPPALVALYHELRLRLAHLLPADLMLKARLVFRRVDDRPAHRVALARIAFSTPLHDGLLARELLDAAIREAAVDLPPQHRAAPPQADAIEALISSPAISADDLALALEWLAEREPAPLERLAHGYRGLAERRPTELRYATALANALEAGGRRGEARAALGQWLARNAAAPAYDRSLAELRIGEIFFNEGRPSEALAAARAAVRWQIDRALWVSALAHEAAGEAREADAMARALRSRHPESPLAALAQAEIDWGRGRPREAAEALAASPHALQTPAGMAALSARFLAVFDESRRAPALSAFEALNARLHPFVLREIVLAAQRAGRHRLAFELGSQLQASALGGAELALTAYQSLRRIEPQDRALAWLAARVPGEVADRLAQLAHRRDAAEAMWLHRAQADDPKAGHVWLLRAAEARLAADAERLAELRALFRAPRADFDGTLLRHVLGLVSEAEVFRLARSPQQYYTMAYFLGARCEAEGRIADALAWYRVVLESGVFTSAPDRDGAVPRYGRLEWWQEMQRTGVLFAPTELRWALGRLPALRDLVLSGQAGAR